MQAADRRVIRSMRIRYGVGLDFLGNQALDLTAEP